MLTKVFCIQGQVCLGDFEAKFFKATGKEFKASDYGVSSLSEALNCRENFIHTVKMLLHCLTKFLGIPEIYLEMRQDTISVKRISVNFLVQAVSWLIYATGGAQVSSFPTKIPACSGQVPPHPHPRVS